MYRSDDPGITPAATVVVFRHAPAGGPPELLMLIRSKTMSFAGGMAVFPGGRVDDADHVLAAQIEHGLDADEAAHRVAAVRETLEESGLAIGVSGEISAATAREARTMLLREKLLAPVLEAFGWQLDLETLTPFARWLPQGLHMRVFDTRFYLADLGTGAVDVAVDQTENSRLFWASAQGVLDMADTGEVKLIYPTRRNLERLAQFATYDEARAQAEAIPVRTITPEIMEQDGQRWLTIPENAGYPVLGEPMKSADRGD